MGSMPPGNESERASSRSVSSLSLMLGGPREKRSKATDSPPPPPPSDRDDLPPPSPMLLEEDSQVFRDFHSKSEIPMVTGNKRVKEEIERRTSVHLHFTQFKSYMKKDKGNFLLRSVYFKMSIGFAIITSAITMGIAAETKASESETIEGPLELIEHLLTGFFVAEMMAKITILRTKYLWDHGGVNLWNGLDLSIVSISVIDNWILPLVIDANGGYDLGLLQIFRLMRLLRIVRLLHSVPELVMVVEGIMGSLKSVFWIILLLLCLLYAVGILCVEVVGAKDGPYGGWDMDEMIIESIYDDFNSYLYFGTLSRAMMSLFSIVLLADWAAVVRPVWEAQPLVGLTFLLLIFVTTLGIFNVIVGVIVERATKAMEKCREETVEIQRQKRLEIIADLAHVVFELDTNGDDTISLKEFEAGTNNERLFGLMKYVGLPHGFTFRDLFRMLDKDGNNSLSKDEFVLGMVRLIRDNPFQQTCSQQLQIGQIKFIIQQLRSSIIKDFRVELRAFTEELTSSTAQTLQPPTTAPPSRPAECQPPPSAPVLPPAPAMPCAPPPPPVMSVDHEKAFLSSTWSVALTGAVAKLEFSTLRLGALVREAAITGFGAAPGSQAPDLSGGLAWERRFTDATSQEQRPSTSLGLIMDSPGSTRGEWIPTVGNASWKEFPRHAVEEPPGRDGSPIAPPPLQTPEPHGLPWPECSVEAHAPFLGPMSLASDSWQHQAVGRIRQSSLPGGQQGGGSQHGRPLDSDAF